MNISLYSIAYQFQQIFFMQFDIIVNLCWLLLY